MNLEEGKYYIVQYHGWHVSGWSKAESFPLEWSFNTIKTPAKYKILKLTGLNKTDLFKNQPNSHYIVFKDVNDKKIVFSNNKLLQAEDYIIQEVASINMEIYKELGL